MAQKQDIRTQLLTASPFQLMLSLSVPAIIGMVVVGLYNFMDRVFVGQLINEVAMGAVSVSYPFTLINTGVSTLIGVGSASVLSRAIGKKDQNTVDKIMGNLIAMNSKPCGTVSAYHLRRFPVCQLRTVCKHDYARRGHFEKGHADYRHRSGFEHHPGPSYDYSNECPGQGN